MDEIAKLQEEFMRLQKQQASHSISERVCVEILLKLIQREKVKVYYTFDRKEFITPKQLSHEIQDEILSSGGRIELMDLYPLLKQLLENWWKMIVVCQSLKIQLLRTIIYIK